MTEAAGPDLAGRVPLAASEPAGAPLTGSRRGAVPPALVEVGLVVLAGGLAFLHLRSAFHPYNDDLLQFVAARESGLGRELLGLNVFGHFAPVNRLAHWAFLERAHLNLTLGAAVAAALVAVLALTVLWVCRELRLSPLRRVLVLALTGLSVAVLDSAVWMDTALHILLALIATYAVLGAHLRALTRGSRGWHALSVGLFGAGLLVQERPAFALPLVVLTDVLLLTAGRPWRERLRVLRGAAAPLAAMATLAATAAVVLRLFYTWGDSRPPLAAVGETIAAAFTGVLFPALVGLPPDRMPSAGTQLAAAGVIGLAAVVLVWWRPVNAGPLTYVVLTFLLYYGFLAFSPILFADNVEWTVLRLHNAVYAVVPAALGLAHLRLSRSGVRRPRAAAVAVAGAVVLLAVTSTVFTAARWADSREAHAYLDAVAAGRDAWSDPDVTVLPLRAPASVATAWATALGRHERLLPLYAPGWTPSPPTGRYVVLDDRGRVRPVALRTEAAGEVPVPGACVTTRPGADALTVPLDAPVTGSALFAVVTYELRGRAVQLTPATGSGGAHWTPSPTPVVLQPGRARVVLPLEGERATAVAVWDVTHGATLCVREVAVVQPVYRVDGRCVALDRYGAPRAELPCRRAGTGR